MYKIVTFIMILKTYRDSWTLQYFCFNSPIVHFIYISIFRLLYIKPSFPFLFLYSLVLWRKLILKHGGQLSNSLDISSLAKITDGYTPGHMITACQQVLTERRISQLTKKQLQAIEFIAPLARMDPVYKEEEESYKVRHQMRMLCSSH